MKLLDDDRAEALEVEDTILWVRGLASLAGKKKILLALQVPDEMLNEAAAIAHTIDTRWKECLQEGETREVKVFVMADCIDGSCHVDEITAEHLAADCVVHYGATYIPQVAKLPVKFVLDKCGDLDNSHLVETLLSEFGASEGEDNGGEHCTVVVAYELKYEHAMGTVDWGVRQLLETGTTTGRNRFVFPKASLKEQRGSPSQTSTSSSVTTHAIGGLEWSIPSEEEGSDRVRYVWVGENEDALALTNFMLVHNTARWFRYDPVRRALSSYGSVSTATRALKRRYFLVEKAKDASIVGIIVGTVSISGYLDALKTLRAIISEAGKKSYTFVMGRITPEKLANYPEIDVFILISHPQLALVDSREFFAPVITPFEGVLAFVPGQSWTGQYTVGFDALNDWAASAGVGVSSNDGEEEEGPTYSLISEGYRPDQEARKVREVVEVNIIQQTENMQLSKGKSHKDERPALPLIEPPESESDGLSLSLL